MLGPLPRLYRIVVSLAAVVVFVAAGAWAAFMASYPLLVSTGASLGLAVGAVCAYVLVHQGRAAAQQPPRVRRQRLH